MAYAFEKLNPCHDPRARVCVALGRAFAVALLQRGRFIHAAIEKWYGSKDNMKLLFHNSCMFTAVSAPVFLNPKPQTLNPKTPRKDGLCRRPLQSTCGRIFDVSWNPAWQPAASRFPTFSCSSRLCCLAEGVHSKLFGDTITYRTESGGGGGGGLGGYELSN